MNECWKPWGMIRHSILLWDSSFWLGRVSEIYQFTKFHTLNRFVWHTLKKFVCARYFVKVKVKNDQRVRNFDFLRQCTHLWTFYHSFMVLCARDYNTIFYSLNFQILYLLLGRVARRVKRPKIYFISFHTHRIDWNHNHRLATATARGFEKKNWKQWGENINPLFDFYHRSCLSCLILKWNGVLICDALFIFKDLIWGMKDHERRLFFPVSLINHL